MNIFILDKDPIIAAQMLCDKHVVKMPLETAQLLCSVFWVSLNNQISLSQIPYKLTHHNHPCSIWSRQSQANFSWLVDYGIAICKEYSFRYNKIHKSEKVIHWCNDNQSRLVFKESKLTTFVQAMPEQYKGKSAIKAYRTYYLQEKCHFAKWEKGRDEPLWLKRTKQDLIL
ncbi:MAG: hypothetical protein sL5_09870 [Candidatus Mesenet longicola]|uniref:Uncharacterized protein n=1 Tax=Candidatus Mesenet longicola TaxID=1892558 RepID=A0A8J3HQ43_9RICK|nr:MAG: hypothetical protein sGL2_10360 [Candidatus Mesenet longicola]GHM59994.1 MAG: hypothetical protein sL5_09870 [Candidatus Mesenet longicola]